MEAPKFNLSAGNLGVASQEELDQKMNEKSGGKGFAPGNYDLQIVQADFHKNKDSGSIFCDGDPTWFNVLIVAEGAEGRQTKYWLQVPTSSLKFGKKQTFFVFKKFSEFMAAIGVPVTTDNVSKVVPQYFSAPSDSLVGRKFNCDIGYEGSHVAKQEDGSYVINNKGKAVTGDDGEVMAFPDVGSAKAIAEGLGIKLTFPNITKFNPAKAAPTAAKQDDGW